MNQDTKTIAVVNSAEIMVIENGDKLVPIKPICEALGIDLESQRKKIKSDDFLNSTAVLSTAVAGDGKEREMFCIPFKYVFGWLFTINPANVKEEAREAVMNYRAQCYDVLYRHFTAKSDYVKSIHEASTQVMDQMDKAKQDFREAKKKLDLVLKKYKKVRSITFEDWEAANGQMHLFDELEESDDDENE